MDLRVSMFQFLSFVHSLILVRNSLELQGKWIKGGDGKTCDQVCNAEDLTCDANKQSELTTNAAVAAAFKEAGYTCKSFHDARDYAGTPFSTGRAFDDCAPVEAGAKSVCNKNDKSQHAALCHCKGTFVCMRVCIRTFDA